MIDYTPLSKEIEAEYEAFCLDKDRSLDLLYQKLFVYLKGKIAGWIRVGNYVDEYTAEELAQDVLIIIMNQGLHTFQKKEASFVTYCSVIAKNKALDYIRRRNRYRMECDETLENMSNNVDSSRMYANPERLIMEYEYRLELIAELKRYLQLMVSWPQKPYRSVASCYTMILFHRYNPNTRELSSPSWAFGEVERETVADSAERFITELNEWIHHIRLDWSDGFYDELDELEDDEYVGNIVFGEHFKVKDFENWSNRLRVKIKKELMEQTMKEEQAVFELT